MSVRFLRAPPLVALHAVMVSVWIGGLMEAAELTPLPTAGRDHHVVAAAVTALSHGDAGPLLALPGHLGHAAAPALADPQDPDLYRRWPAVIPAALARLPADRLTAVRPLLAPLLEHERAVAAAFDRGRLGEVLLLAPTDPRAAAARELLGLDAGSLAAPALPTNGPGTAPMPLAGPLRLGDGWLFAVTAESGILWQRRIERQAHVVIGLTGALVSQTSGLWRIDLHGEASPLPHLPAFARPLAVHGRWAWFAAGTRLWRLDLEQGGIATLDLPEAPLGPPVLRGNDGWWLTRHALVTTHGTTISDRLPHLLALSPIAILAPLPGAALIRDGDRWWRVGPRAEAPVDNQVESLLLAGDIAAAKSLLARTTDFSESLRFRVELTRPQTTQEHAIIALIAARAGNPQAFAQLDEPAVLTEPATELRWPIGSWPHRVSLTAWRAQDALLPTIMISADATSVTVRAAWADPARWWERTWSTRPLLDAPARSWALIPGAVAIADGADHLLVADVRTGAAICEHTLPAAVDPAAVVRTDHGAAALAEGGRVLLVLTRETVTRLVLPAPAAGLTARNGRAVVQLENGQEWMPAP